jgi:ABC-type multidrug transport system fused ATPase/permease subunit
MIKQTLFHQNIQRKTIVYYVIFTMVDVLAMMSIPFLYKQILDVLTTRNTESFFTYMGLLAILFLVHVVSFIGKQILASTTILHLIKETRRKVMHHLLYTSSTELSRFHSGDLASRLDKDLDILKVYLLSMSDLLYQASVFLFAIVYGFMVSIELLVVTLVIMVLAMLLNQGSSKPLTKYAKHLQEAYARLNNFVKESIKGIKTIKAYELEDQRIKVYEQDNASITKREKQIVKRRLLITMIQTILMVLPMQVINLYGGHLSFKGQITIGEFGLFLAIITYFIHPVSYFVGLQASKKTAQASKRRIVELYLPMEEDQKDILLNNNQPILQVEQLSFFYEDHKPVLRDLNFCLEDQGFVMILGQSGSGKSTLFQLLSKILKPSKGTIKVYGQDIEEACVRKAMALSAQESYLFPKTVFENIGYGKMNASEEEIIQAAKDAQIHDFVMTLPKGYQTPISEDGQNFSGGQRQRISLARAFLKDAPILLVDEPTSALDQETKQAILQVLKEKSKDHLVLMITHHKKDTKYADTLFSLEDGRLSKEDMHPLKDGKKLKLDYVL